MSNYHMVLNIDKAEGVTRQRHSAASRYMTENFDRNEIINVSFEEDHVEFETVGGERVLVNFDELEE